MSDPPENRRELILVRHGETEWTLTGQHTGRTDIELTAHGRHQAEALGGRLRPFAIGAAWTSPLRRARDTAALAGFPTATIDADLAEWDYGDYEARTTADIRSTMPGWSLWRDGTPSGEDSARVGARVDRFLDRLPAEGRVALFAHGHLLRVLAARWLGQPPENGRLFALAPGSVSVLAYEREQPVIRSWNVTA